MEPEIIKAMLALLAALGWKGVLALFAALNLFPAVLVLSFWWMVERRREVLAREGREERRERDEQERTERQERERAWQDALTRSLAKCDLAISRCEEAEDQHQREVNEVLRDYGDSLAQVIKLYENNAELVRAFSRLSDDFHTTITLNTQVMQKVCDKIDSNQFCPVLKERMGKVGS